ncbi:MAG: DHH family phosphoesterase, partial [Myxococcota bacterium]|nr:DHH family phosphoesterase [Myxococcota bacterium]
MDASGTAGPRAVDAPEAAAILARARTVILTGHRNPDGDCVGSVLGLAHVLRRRGAEVACFFPDGVPEAFRFLHGAAEVVREVAAGAAPFDLAVALDCGDPRVLPRQWPGPRAYRALLVVDHHAVRNRFGDWTLVERAACVGQIVLRIAETLGYDLDRPLAEAVYVSLVTDTGFFRYPETTPEALRLAARLLEAGVSPWEVAYAVDEGYPAARIEMLAAVLGTLGLHDAGRVAVLTVPPGLLERLGLGTEHLENVVNFARAVRGVEVAIQVRLNEEGKTRVSLRSCGRIDVAAIAALHGGGGHHNAAGCTVDASLEPAAAAIVAD